MANGAYSLKVPTWDGTGTLPVPAAPADTGYDAHYATRKSRPGLKRANGQLNNSKVSWPLFVTDVEIDFQINGNIGQSRYTRDFYPQNFVQPAFTVMGQSRDNKDYGMMCDFVHMCQKNMLNNFAETNLIQLQVAQRGFSGVTSKIKNNVRELGAPGFVDKKGNRIHRTVNGVEILNSTFQLDQSDNYSAPPLANSGSAKGVSPAVTVTKPGSGGSSIFWNEMIRGPHKEILCIGVVTNMQRIHQKFVYWPTWTFEFQVYRMILGPYREGPNTAGTGNFKTWVDLLENSLLSPGSVSTTAAMLKENNSTLQTVLKDSQNIFNSTSGHGSFTPGGSGGSGGGGGGGGSGPAKGTMYDSANHSAAGFPANPDAVAGYIDDGGDGDQLFSRFPSANHLSISREADGNVGDCLDVESGCPGAYPPSRAGAWAKRRIASGSTPVLYSNQSDYPGVIASLKSAGVKRSQYKYWLAKLTDKAPTFPISGFDVDAVQYQQGVNGCDISVYSDGFFS